MSVWFDRGANRWRIRIKRNGREVARYLPPGITKQQAEETHTNLMREFFDKTTLNKKPRRTIVEALTKYMEDHNGHNKHPENAASNIRALVPFIEGQYLDACGAVAEAVRGQSQWSPATRNRRLALLRRVCNLAFREWGWLDKPVVLGLLPERNARDVRLTAGEVRKLARAAGKYLPLAEHWILLAAYTGLRRSELQGLRAADVRQGAIHLGDTKNGRPRIVPVHPRARGSLAVWIMADPRPHPRWLYRQFERACEDCGLDGIHFHDLRHFFASELVNAGVDLHTVGRILGHVDHRSTARYSHLDTSALERAVRRVK